jgi:hypothetical protein
VISHFDYLVLMPDPSAGDCQVSLFDWPDFDPQTCGADEDFDQKIEKHYLGDAHV